MLRAAVHLLLILDLLACPLFCPAGCWAAVNRCAGACCPSQAELPPPSDDDCCDCCCTDAEPVDPNPAEAPDRHDDSSRERGPTPKPCVTDCICKGALTSRPVVADDLSGEALAAAADVIDIDLEAGATAERLPTPPEPPAGARLRALLMSYLC